MATRASHSATDSTMDNTIGYWLALDSPHATLERVGGKGLNLARLARRGFAVPDGFLIPTAAYQDFIHQHDLATWLRDRIYEASPDDPHALNAVSAQIRARFRASAIPPAIADAVRAGYMRLGQPPVAVRSSATAEDLPDMSFAGQQDTFLNVQGMDALLDATRECWSSLWTARAIAYRSRNNVAHDEIALAVIVEQMVQSEVSGVLFTANPLNGRRHEIVIDATLGLGEALVSGLVEPDQYVIECTPGKDHPARYAVRILEKRLGAKTTVIRGRAGGGTVTETHEASNQPALSDAAIETLARLGQQVADEYDSPQDIEWAYADGQFYVLQSRPITSLFPLPSAAQKTNAQAAKQEHLRVYLSFGGLQGVLSPFTPLGQDTVQAIAAGGARLFGSPTATAENQTMIHVAGERLWIDFTNIVRNSIGRQFIERVLPIGDPGSITALKNLFDDPRVQPEHNGLSQATIARIAPVFLRLLRTAVGSVVRPDRSRATFHARAEAKIAQVEQQARTVQNPMDWIAFHREICYEIFPLLIPQFMPRLVAGYLPLNLLHRLATQLAKSDESIDGQTALELTRGLPHNVTTEMDLALWRLAQTIKQQDPAAVTHFLEGEATQLAQQYLAGELPPIVQAALADFLARYGMRGVAEIDFGRPRWAEQPAPLLRTLQSYLRIEDTKMAPDAVFRRGDAAATTAIDKLARAAAKQWGAFGHMLVHGLARRVRALAGLRETPKFTVVKLLGISRDTLLRLADTAATADPETDSSLQPEDLFFLHLNELAVWAMGAPGDWQQLVARRRARYAREMERKLIPRVLLSDGTTIYEGLGAVENADGVITGSPGFCRGCRRAGAGGVRPGKR